MFGVQNQFICAAAATVLGLSAASQMFAQGNLPVASTGDQVVIKREACRVIEPSRYRVPLSLEGIQTVSLVAPFDGTIRQIAAKTNAKVQSQGEIIRLDDTVQKLYLKRAEAALKIATLELRQGGKEGNKDDSELAQAKVDLAKVDVDIAQSTIDRATVRIPFEGEVQRILVAEGQFVKAGEPIAIVADHRMMKVEIPVDRATAEVGKKFGIRIESIESDGKIEAVLPLPTKFEPLRDLFDSIASVQVVVDNGAGKLKVGQTVYAPMIPRQPVAEVANSAVGNQADGKRKVQVIRQNVVRDIPVVLMGQVGTARVFVSGAFADNDEVVYESSHQLNDGFQLKPATTGGGTPTTGAPTTTTTPATNNKSPTGF